MHNNEISNKLTTVEMVGDSLEMATEALEMSTEALEMYHEGTEMYHEGMDMSTEALEMYHEGTERYHEGVEMSTEALEASENIEDELELTPEEKEVFDALGDSLEESMFEMEAELNPNSADAPIEGGSANVCRSSQTPQNYCVFSGASRR